MQKRNKQIMCYIDTHTMDSMINSLIKIFDITIGDLSDIFCKANYLLIKTEYTDMDMLKELFYKFIEQKMQPQHINYVYFYHLGRRLNSTVENNDGKNLFELLLKETPLSSFFKGYDITFKEYKNQLNIIYQGNLISLEDSEKEFVYYLKQRMGQNSEHNDYCFNGFMFKEKIINNRYTLDLASGPEFLTRLATFLDKDNIIDDYIKNSTYYCFEYLVPIEKIFFASAEQLSKEEKQKYLLYQVLYRLFNDYDEHDNDNPILRLADNDTMESKYFKRKEKVSI